MNEITAHYADLMEAAAIVGIHPHSLRRLMKRGRLPIPTRMFAGKYLFERAALETFASQYDPRPMRKTYPGLL